MIQLLNIEWMKVKAYRTFWILTILFFVAVPTLNIAIESFVTQTKQVSLLLGSPFAFPRVWDTAAWVASLVTPVMGIMLIIFLTNENNFRTVRQNIIDGWSRDQYITAKFGVLITTTLFITLLIVVTALLFGLKNGTGDATENIIYIFYAFVQSLAYLSLAFFLGVFMKRAGIAIAIYVMYAYVGEFVVAGLLDYKVIRHLGAFLPLECTDRLIPGISNIARKLVDQGNPPPSNTQYVLIALFYIALFNFLSWRKIKKADL